MDSDELQADASDEAFSYFLCCVCLVKEIKGTLWDALNDSCSMDVVQAVHKQLSAKIAEHKESKINGMAVKVQD